MTRAAAPPRGRVLLSFAVAEMERLFAALNDAEVRYVVVGGVAAVLHGVARLTGDLDLVVDLEPGEALRAVELLGRLGYRPWAPVRAEGFADPEERARWRRERNLVVFTMVHRDDPSRIVDLFVESPVEFGGLWSRAVLLRAGAALVRVAGFEDLVEMKRRAGRPKDLLDLEELERIRRIRGAP